MHCMKFYELTGAPTQAEQTKSEISTLLVPAVSTGGLFEQVYLARRRYVVQHNPCGPYLR